jgi:hypothetical protein
LVTYFYVCTALTLASLYSSTCFIIIQEIFFLNMFFLISRYLSMLTMYIFFMCALKQRLRDNFISEMNTFFSNLKQYLSILQYLSIYIGNLPNSQSACTEQSCFCVRVSVFPVFCFFPHLFILMLSGYRYWFKLLCTDNCILRCLY